MVDIRFTTIESYALNSDPEHQIRHSKKAKIFVRILALILTYLPVASQATANDAQDAQPNI